LTVDVNNGRAVVNWTVDRADSRPISGYNIYLSEKPLQELFRKWDRNRPEPYNHGPFPGDTDGDNSKESYEITNLANGKTYYVSVRTVDPAGDESDAAGELKFVPLANGQFQISSDHSSDKGGFSFDKNISLPARDPRCDIYLYAKKDVAGLSSPHRLSGGLRKTAFSNSKEKGVETIRIKGGDKLTVKTGNGRAEITVVKIRHRGSSATADIRYIFYPLNYGK
jgi:hypothetical protein